MAHRVGEKVVGLNFLPFSSGSSINGGEIIHFPGESPAVGGVGGTVMGVGGVAGAVVGSGGVPSGNRWLAGMVRTNDSTMESSPMWE